jgi:hypothetical protein
MTDNTDTSVPGPVAPAPPRPQAVSLSTPPGETFKEAMLMPGGGVLVYLPETNAMLALFADEYRALLAEGDEHSKKIADLQKANQRVTDASIALRAAQKAQVKADIDKAEAALQQAISDMVKASDEVKKKLEPLSKLDAKDGVKMIEMVGRKSKKYDVKAPPIYVKSTSIAKALADKRIYLMVGDRSKPDDEKVFKNGKLNSKGLQQYIAANVQDKTKFTKEWKLSPEDADEYSGVLSNWARVMNSDIATLIEKRKDDIEKYFDIDSNDPKRRVDLSADAQLMRYTAGAGLEMNFNPFAGNLNHKRDDTWIKRVKRGVQSGEFGIKANAKASFAIAEGRVRTEVYLPHFAGFHVTPTIGGQTFEFGYIRLYADMVLTGGAGASLAIEAEIAVNYTGGREGLRGVPGARPGKGGVKAASKVAGELDAFAGARAAIDLTGAIQWLNPEGEDSDGKPLEVKPGDAVGEFKTMAKVGFGGGVSAGAGVKGAFRIGIEKGNFVVRAKLGLCVGLGAEGAVSGEVGYETIGEFFKFVAYQLKRADYHKLGDFIDKDTYDIYCKVYAMVIAKGEDLKNYVGKIGENIEKEYQLFKTKLDSAIKSGSQEAQDFMRRMREQLSKQTGSWFSYAPPEAVGQLQRYIALAGMSDNLLLREQAPQLMAMSLGAPQTTNQLATIAERMTEVMGDKQNQLAGLSMIDNCLAGSRFAGELQATQQRLASAQALSSKPFIWNSEPEFVAARMGIEDAMYS